MEIKVCVLIAVITGAVLLFYYFQNKDRRIERFFIRKDKKMFILLQTTYLVLVLSLMLNIRYMASYYLSPIMERMQVSLKTG